jgi:hypothetical protein
VAHRDIERRPLPAWAHWTAWGLLALIVLMFLALVFA